MSKVKMTAAEKAALLEETTGRGIVDKVGINDRGNAIVVHDAPTDRGSNRVIRVIEMVAGTDLGVDTDLKISRRRNVVASKVVERYVFPYGSSMPAEAIESYARSSGRDDAVRRRYIRHGIDFAERVLSGEQKMPQSLGI